MSLAGIGRKQRPAVSQVIRSLVDEAVLVCPPELTPTYAVKLRIFNAYDFSVSSKLVINCECAVF